MIWYPCSDTYHSKYDSDVIDRFELYTLRIGADTIRRSLYEHISHLDNGKLAGNQLGWVVCVSGQRAGWHCVVRKYTELGYQWLVQTLNSWCVQWGYALATMWTTVHRSTSYDLGLSDYQWFCTQFVDQVASLKRPKAFQHSINTYKIRFRIGQAKAHLEARYWFDISYSDKCIDKCGK